MTPRPATTIAAIDLGTNTVLLTIAALEGAGALRVLRQEATVTRLGTGVDKNGCFDKEASKRTLQCLRDYRRLMDDLGVSHARAVGTSALRDVQGGSEFLHDARELLGFELEVISGITEAKLSFLGALDGLAIKGDVFVFDIGGGSTELIFGNATTGKIFSCTSLQIGSVRLTERLRFSDPPNSNELEQLRSLIRSSVSESGLKAPALQQSSSPPQIVGVAGTMTTLGAIDQKMNRYDSNKIHGYRLDSRTISQLGTQLASATLKERLLLPGLSAGRADVIIAGAIICDEITRSLHTQHVTISDRGVRFGLLRNLQTTLNSC